MRAYNEKKRNRYTVGFAAALVLFFFFVTTSPVQSGEPSYASPQEYAWSKYYKYHPAKRHLDSYPYAGAPIRAGQDIPVCDAAKMPEAYLYKREVRYIIHGKNGWLFRTDDFRNDFTASPSTIDYFRRLNRALESRGQTLVIAFQPPRAMMEQKHIDPAAMPKDYNPEAARRAYKAFLQQLKSAGLVVTDLSVAPPGMDYFPSTDFHWSPDGARYSAQLLAETIKNLDGYSSLKKQDFTNKAVGFSKNPVRGAFANFIQSTCKINIEMTKEKVWKTEAVASGSESASLLGDDASIPAITIIGTSNSAEDEKFNFVGSLKQFLRSDIYNASIVAGGFGSPGLRYFSSEEYKSAPPKFVIWEFLPQHRYNSEDARMSFRQMIPAIYGACPEKEALASYSGDITQTQTSLFPDIKGKTFRDAYLYMEVLDPAERNLKLNVLYADGNIDKADLTRSTRAANNGKYYLDLDKIAEQSPVLFQLITDKPQGRVNARLCQYPVNIASR